MFLLIKYLHILFATLFIQILIIIKKAFCVALSFFSFFLNMWRALFSWLWAGRVMSFEKKVSQGNDSQSVEPVTGSEHKTRKRERERAHFAKLRQKKSKKKKKKSRLRKLFFFVILNTKSVMAKPMIIRFFQSTFQFITFAQWHHASFSLLLFLSLFLPFFSSLSHLGLFFVKYYNTDFRSIVSFCFVAI